MHQIEKFLHTVICIQGRIYSRGGPETIKMWMLLSVTTMFWHFLLLFLIISRNTKYCLFMFFAGPGAVSLVPSPKLKSGLVHM
jgi:hypothetical protein